MIFALAALTAVTLGKSIPPRDDFSLSPKAEEMGVMQMFASIGPDGDVKSKRSAQLADILRNKLVGVTYRLLNKEIVCTIARDGKDSACFVRDAAGGRTKRGFLDDALSVLVELTPVGPIMRAVNNAEAGEGVSCKCEIGREVVDAFVSAVFPFRNLMRALDSVVENASKTRDGDPQAWSVRDCRCQ